MARLETYYRLLARWNRSTNLTGFDLEVASAEVIDRLFIEPMAAARYAAATTESVIDIGSGGGSPAIPFAVMLGADVRLVLIESKTRKAVFLREAARAVGLAHEVVASRYEDAASSDAHLNRYDVLTIRAVRIESASLTTLGRFVKPSGRMFLFGSETNPSESSATLPPELGVSSRHILVQSLGSRLTIVAHSAPGHVPRGTIA